MSKRQRTARNQYHKREQGGRIEGPGVFVTCVRGKEKQTVSELYDVFESIAADIWPEERLPDADDEKPSAGDSVEDELARELETLKRPRKEKQFSSVDTETACFLWIACQPPVDPLRLVTAYLEEVEKTRKARTRFVQRLIPVSNICAPGVQEIVALATKLFPPIFEQPNESYRYKIEISIINHSRLKREDIIDPVAKAVPADRGHVVDLKRPEVVILIQIFRTVCGISVVKNWQRFRKFNVIQLAEDKQKDSEVKTEEVGGAIEPPSVVAQNTGEAPPS